MGSKHLGPDWNIVKSIQKQSGIDTFIETGTWKGGTTAQAASLFDYVLTIEGMPGRWWKTWNNTLRHKTNVATLTGDSATVLPFILTALEVPALFWLDAHYCTTNQEEKAQGLAVCPVMYELLAINAHKRAHLHVVMVDDARLFGVEKGWPREDVLLSELKKHDRRVICKDDIWYGLPPGLDGCYRRIIQ